MRHNTAMGIAGGALRLAGTVLKALVALVVVGVAGFLALTHVFGMRMELAGSGLIPIITFQSPEDHITELERERVRR